MLQYEFTKEAKDIGFGIVLHRIRACMTFRAQDILVKEGDLGGWLEKSSNLPDFPAHGWVADEACVYDDAVVTENAIVYENAHVGGHTSVTGMSRVHGETHIGGTGKIEISGSAELYDHAVVAGNEGIIKITDGAKVYENAYITVNAAISEHARVHGKAWIEGSARVSGEADVSGRVTLTDSMLVTGNARILCESDSSVPLRGNAILTGNAQITRPRDYLVIGPINYVGAICTFFKAADGKIYVTSVDPRYAPARYSTIKAFPLDAPGAFAKELNRCYGYTPRSEDLKSFFSFAEGQLRS